MHAPSSGRWPLNCPTRPRQALADIYQVFSQGPLPGESLLHVEPLPAAPHTYTVPFASAGFLVYVADHHAAPSSWWA
jgi:hypothetical protein